MNDEYNTYYGKAYRFITFEGLFNTIENKSLRFTRVDKFNDPLDNSPYLAPLDWKKYSQYGGTIFSKFVNDYVFSKVFKSLFICCFCKEYNTEYSYLMWSHYGKSHTQVCFEIDFSIHDYLGRPSEVFYPKNLVAIREKFTSNKEGSGLFLVTNKSKVWAYEKEVRLIVDREYPQLDLTKCKISEDSLFLYWHFDLSKISKIIFGINADLNDMQKTHNMFLVNKLDPKYEKMYIDPISLKLNSHEYRFN